MKLIIHITRHIDTIDQGQGIFDRIQQQFADDPLFHVNAIADHNFKHPEPADSDQTSNPFGKKTNVTTSSNPA